MIQQASEGHDATTILEHLKADRQTGCLTVQSVEQGAYRVYLQFGRVYHAEGPSGDGQRALDEALMVRNATLSFDDHVRLPEKHTIGAPPPSGFTLSPPGAASSWERWQRRWIVRSCLVTVVFFGLVVPLGVLIVGVNLLGPALRSEAAYRSAPACTSASPTSASCWRIEPATVLFPSDQFDAGTWREMVTVAAADGQHILVIDEAFPFQPRPTFSSAKVQVKIYAGRMTELDTGESTYQTRESPLTQSLVGLSLTMTAVGGLYLLVLVARRRTRLLGDGQWILSMWKGTS